MAFDVPVLFIVFNRPDTTENVFQRIREIKPAKLFVAADGPRTSRQGEKEKCDAVRKIILDGVDWKCDLKIKLSDINLGCGRAESSAMLWFLEEVGEGIVIEDDTLPDQSFFYFCKELLVKYRNDESVKMICGNNFQKGIQRGDGSYYFSGYTHSWGYASWWRAWKDYDFRLEKIDNGTFESLLNQRFDKEDEKKYWREVYRNFRNAKYDTWDFQFLFTMWMNGGRTIIPNINLVTNIGFGLDATHTTEKNSRLSGIPHSSIGRIVHPSNTSINKEADAYTFYEFLFPKKRVLSQVLKRIKQKIFPQK